MKYICLGYIEAGIVWWCNSIPSYSHLNAPLTA
jgi:hypothetical protein